VHVQAKQKSARIPPHVSARERFGIAIRQARLKLEISQEELAARAGMHRTYIAQVEAGKRNVAIDNLEKLADAVGIPLWQMLRP
jgi:transcriptional regulator with XRE-family HTH domain